MTPTTMDWVLWGAAALAGATALVFLTCFAVGDRSRGRRRCPRCWYEMTGSPTLVCPECGRDARRERRLFRTRRRWRWAVAAAALLMLTLSLGATPTIRHNGWRESVPGAVLVTVWPLSVEAWTLDKFNGTPSSNTMLRELNRRINDGTLSSWECRWWTDRVRRHLERGRVLGTNDLDATLQAMKDARLNRSFRDARLADVFSTLEADLGITVHVDWESLRDPLHVSPETRVTADLVNSDVFDALNRLGLATKITEYLLTCSVEPDAIVVGGSDEGRFQVWEIGDLVDALMDARDRFDPPRESDPASVPCFQYTYTESEWRRDNAEPLAYCITTFIDPECWFEGGGEVGNRYVIDDRLFVRAPSYDIAAIDSLIQSLRRCLSPQSEADRIVTVDPEEWNAAAALLKRLTTMSVALSSPIPMPEDVLEAVGVAVGAPVDQSGLISPGMALATRESPSSAAGMLDHLVTDVGLFDDGTPRLRWTVWHGTIRVFDADESPSPYTLMRLYNIMDLIDFPPSETTAEDQISNIVMEITASIDPGSWIEGGGEVGRIRSVGPCLVISTTARIHLQIEELLAELRVKHGVGKGDGGSAAPGGRDAAAHDRARKSRGMGHAREGDSR